MKFQFIPVWLGCALLALVMPLNALAAEGDPIIGVDANLGKNPGGALVARDKTDAKGVARFPKVMPGMYDFTAKVAPDNSKIKKVNVSIKLDGKSLPVAIGDVNSDGVLKVAFTVPGREPVAILIGLLLPAVQK